ncbi:MAG: hypothetical protein KatS3mg087_0581 [Patescibacteria group bacterium]|nr:MAG: hypothetical protein KatS3mg087_0581 [Patescibacteria group bacterium]
MKIALFAAIVNAVMVLPTLGAPVPDVPWCRDGETPPGCRPTQQDVDPDKSSKPEKCSRGGDRREGCPSPKGGSN